VTTRKREVQGSRPSSYVSREDGAAELRISVDTWDEWVKDGRIPPCAPGFPESTPRWRWADVDARLAGKTETSTDPAVNAAANFNKHGPQKNGKYRAA
jgi:hypothetical protein